MGKPLSKYNQINSAVIAGIALVKPITYVMAICALYKSKSALRPLAGIGIYRLPFAYTGGPAGLHCFFLA